MAGGDWRCSNCGEVANDVDEYTALDPRFTTGRCGNCTLRATVPLVFGTYVEVMAVVKERIDKKLRSEQMARVKTGFIADHVRAVRCCSPKETKREHLPQERLDVLLSLMGLR